ncbi:hypothetical protein [Actinophytocola algeriensis]|uniref:Uncharacterized protein n=1 Tax=Actinophytocola algeriensis TaxID=1768010 RepID=A0A7W7VHN0_9PSEU|nr:hypothetical protein [Actinophytocola algeriensis]MBB4910230.1 hypothetical protein [Actinophytocola algeriensis]MBE1480781.1 hypothetical protein [Actinophytocola algeriensis]
MTDDGTGLDAALCAEDGLPALFGPDGSWLLAGHPLRTVTDLYPSLAGDENLCADFGYSVLGAGGMVLSVHGKNTLVLSALKDWSPA